MQQKGKENLLNFSLRHFLELSCQELWSTVVNIFNDLNQFPYLRLLQIFLRIMVQMFLYLNSILMNYMLKHCGTSQIGW